MQTMMSADTEEKAKGAAAVWRTELLFTVSLFPFLSVPVLHVLLLCCYHYYIVVPLLLLGYMLFMCCVLLLLGCMRCFGSG